MSDDPGIRADCIAEIEMKENNTKATIDTTITMGSGDVFTDLGFSPAESRNLPIGSEMMTALSKAPEK